MERRSDPVLCVFDKKTKLYDKPFSIRHVGEAVREFETLKTQKDNKIGMNPDDFELHHIGQFQFEIGTLVPNDQNIPVA